MRTCCCRVALPLPEHGRRHRHRSFSPRPVRPCATKGRFGAGSERHSPLTPTGRLRRIPASLQDVSGLRTTRDNGSIPFPPALINARGWRQRFGFLRLPSARPRGRRNFSSPSMARRPRLTNQPSGLQSQPPRPGPSRSYERTGIRVAGSGPAQSCAQQGGSGCRAGNEGG